MLDLTGIALTTDVDSLRFCRMKSGDSLIWIAKFFVFHLSVIVKRSDTAGFAVPSDVVLQTAELGNDEVFWK
jgi:hypothetical protein